MSNRDRAIPERLGRYEIVERLSAGGMGEVFVARFVGPGGFVKPVALKRIHPHLAEDEQFIHMLHDEANVAAAVKHPNIVVTIDVGFEDGNHFVVMDFVSGDPLSRLLRDLKKRDLVMPPWVVAWVGAQTAGALHSAHEARNLHGEALEIVHRDVSLQNVMLSDAGHAMLFDFGVAKAKQRIVKTSHGELKGKLAYMAPETFRGAPVDRTVDVFGLGVVLYELLTNVSPFQRGSDVDTITALQTAPIELPSRLKPVDPRLDSIVLTAMARERARRYPTAAHVEHALRDWARSAGLPHEASAVADWLAATFPERIAARRGLLGRVADMEHRPVPAIDRMSGQGVLLTPHPSAPGMPFAQAGWGATPGVGYALLTGPGLPTDPHAVVAATGSQVTVGGISRHPTLAPPSNARARVVGAGAAAVLAGGVLAYFVVARSGAAPADAATSSAATSAASATASSAPSASASPAVSPAASSPIASATPTVAAALPVTPRSNVGRRPTSPPAEPPSSKSRSPIAREY